MSLPQDGEIYIKVDSKGDTSRHLVAWDDGPGGQVSQICIWHDDIIRGIQTTYERNGSSVLSSRHGGTEGDFEVISFSEPLTWISGHYGSWCYDPEVFASEDDAPDCYYTMITSLKFGTGRQTYGPFGREYGRPFSFKMSTGCAGLHGSAIQHCGLNSIGVYVSSKANSLIERIPPPPVVAAPSADSMLESSSESEVKKSIEM